MTSSPLRTGINFLELGTRLMRKPLSPRGDFSPLQKSGCLIILDIHGVLVERIATRDRVRWKRAMDRRRPWRQQRNHSIWLRPYLKRFLDTLFARHDVAVWSSAQPQTIDEFLTSISREFRMSPPFREKLSFIWDRSKCRPDRENGKYATMKYLQDLWQDAKLANKYSSRNTLLLDDSPSKNRFFPNSGIVVPEYSADLLQDRYNKDDTLLWLLLYIEYLISVPTGQSEGEVVLDLSQSRVQCLTFQDFIYEGELMACRLTNSKRRKRFKSLAMVFLNDLDLQFNVPQLPPQPSEGNGEEQVRLPETV